MEEEENNTKEYNDEEFNETPPDDNSKKVISLENANFTKKSQPLNSPRSLEACYHLGIEPSELYKLNMDEFNKKYPEVKRLSQDLVKYRYEGEEKFRNETIEDVKKERERIIEEIKKKKKSKKKKKIKIKIKVIKLKKKKMIKNGKRC